MSKIKEISLILLTGIIILSYNSCTKNTFERQGEINDKETPVKNSSVDILEFSNVCQNFELAGAKEKVIDARILNSLNLNISGYSTVRMFEIDDERFFVFSWDSQNNQLFEAAQEICDKDYFTYYDPDFAIQIISCSGEGNGCRIGKDTDGNATIIVCAEQ
ncbi:MAG: hypothetical protein LBH92_01010 [Bacteroidales bacterium]|jgi:hypothetical protein|nr:hypothetical protein [Bacteroidales bacterium]